MLYVEAQRPLFRFLEAFLQCAQRVVVESLAATQLLLCQRLSFSPLDIGGLILKKVQQEPQVPWNSSISTVTARRCRRQ